MNDYNPDAWVILKINHEGEVTYKILCGYYGGYLNGDSWRLNSGITEYSVDHHNKIVIFSGYSGSVYYCHLDCERYTGLTASIAKNFIVKAEEHGSKVKHISFADFSKEFAPVAN